MQLFDLYVPDRMADVFEYVSLGGLWFHPKQWSLGQL
jgi:hypothetical protein